MYSSARTVAKLLSSRWGNSFEITPLCSFSLHIRERREKTSRYKRKQISLPYLAVYLLMAVGTERAVFVWVCSSHGSIIWYYYIGIFCSFVKDKSHRRRRLALRPYFFLPFLICANCAPLNSFYSFTRRVIGWINFILYAPLKANKSRGDGVCKFLICDTQSKF